MSKPIEIEIHPGHWKNEGSGANGLIKEAVENRRVAQEVSKILKRNGVPTNYFEDNTSTNKTQNVNALVKHHNKDCNALVVSIHFNSSGAIVDGPIGTEVLYYDQKQLATDLAFAIAAAGRFKNRGAKQRKDIGVLVSTVEPAVLIEVCFVNSKRDVEQYNKNFDKITHAIAKVLAAHIGYTIK